MAAPLDITNEQSYEPIAGALLHRIVRFTRALREVGVDVNPGRTADLVNSLPLIDLSRRDDFYYTCRTTLLARNDLREAFDSVGEGDTLELYCGATSGAVFGSADAGSSWFDVATHLPPVLSVAASGAR